MNPHVANLVITSLLVGLIWVIQLIVYPSFAYISEEKWHSFHQMHTRRISCLVVWLMPLELAVSLWGAFISGSDLINLSLVACVILIWLSTFFLQVPAHNKLAQGKALHEINFLVSTNWVRTILWSLKLVLLVLALIKN